MAKKLFLLRIPEALHRIAHIAAASDGKNLTAWILQAIRAGILRAARRPGGEAVKAAMEAGEKTAEQAEGKGQP